MNYLVQAWERTKGEWRTAWRCRTRAGVKLAISTLSADGPHTLRVLAQPSPLDVLDMLHELEQSGLVDVRLVDTEWRWTVREGVK